MKLLPQAGFGAHTPDPELAAFDGRVARLYRAHGEVGLLYVRLDAYATQTSGHLWWRRFAEPEDALDLEWIVDHQCGDSVVTGQAVGDELRDWQAGRFRLRGEQLRLEWASTKDSEALRRSHFPDEPGRGQLGH